MYNVNLTVKDLNGFSLSISEMDKVLRPDAGDTATQETIEVDRHVIEGMYDGSASLAELLGKWLRNDKRNPPMQKGECFRCGDVVDADDLIEVQDEDNDYGLCSDCFGRMNKQEVRRQSTADIEPSATISRKDFTDLLACRDIVKRLGVVASHGDQTPILAETFLDKVAGTPLFDVYGQTLPTVTPQVTVKESYPCLCNIDSQGDGDSCPDVDTDGNHTTETVIDLVDVLTILGIDIDKSAFDIASFIAAYQKQNDGEMARIPF